MVTIYKVDNSNITNNGKFLVEFRGLSDDDKPTSVNGGTIENGSTFIEIDTGDTYMYDLENTTWYKVESGNGGESMQKFDYIIPVGIDLSELSSGDEISDTDVTDVLNEIRTDLADGLKPIIVGLYYDDSDGNSCFSTSTALQYYSGLETICFVANSGINIFLSYSTNKWYLYTA